MADLRESPAFSGAVGATRHAIIDLARNHRVPDALALYNRERGVNNLQGHANSIVPLAVLMARIYPGILPIIRARTDIRNELGSGNHETRDRRIWDPVKNAAHLVIQTHGDDIIAETIGTAEGQTVEEVANTYLSVRFGGGQPRGGAGDTVVKRTLKLLAHLWIDL